MPAHTPAADWQLRHRIPVTSGEVAADAFGDGPPVVLVHGTPSWSYLWRRIVPLLAPTHRVYVWDLPGYGSSRLAAGATPSIAAQARTLAELVDHWELDAPALVGTDIGGGIAVRAHLVDEVPASRLALLDAAVLGPWNTAFTEHLQTHADAYRTMPNDVFHDIIAKRIRTATHQPMSDTVAHAYLAPWSGPEGQRRWVEQVEAVRHEDTRAAVERMGGVTAPTLVLWGEQDGWLPLPTAERLAAAIPTARAETIPEAGHFLAEDAPDATARALLRFLDDGS